MPSSVLECTSATSDRNGMGQPLLVLQPIDYICQRYGPIPKYVIENGLGYEETLSWTASIATTISSLLFG